MGEEASKQEIKRNPDGTFPPGVSGNPNGRPKGSVKDYLKVKLAEMTPAEKDEWLKNMPKELQWQMAEGRPQQDVNAAVNISHKPSDEDEIAVTQAIHGLARSEADNT
jgi:hypothetical protein